MRLAKYTFIYLAIALSCAVARIFVDPNYPSQDAFSFNVILVNSLTTFPSFVLGALIAHYLAGKRVEAYIEELRKITQP